MSENVAALTCPRCSTDMVPVAIGADSQDDVQRCPQGHGVFLSRSGLGDLIDAESDWHKHAKSHTMPMPRITEDMEAPPTPKVPSRAFVETLFRE